MKVAFYIVVSSTNKAGSAYYFIFLRSVRSIYTNEQNKGGENRYKNKTGLKGAENRYKNKTGLKGAENSYKNKTGLLLT